MVGELPFIVVCKVVLKPAGVVCANVVSGNLFKFDELVVSISSIFPWVDGLKLFEIVDSKEEMVVLNNSFPTEEDEWISAGIEVPPKIFSVVSISRPFGDLVDDKLSIGDAVELFSRIILSVDC